MQVPSPHYTPSRNFSIEAAGDSDGLVVYRRSFGSLAQQISFDALDLEHATPSRLQPSAPPVVYWSVTFHGATRGQEADGYLRLEKAQLHTIIPKARQSSQVSIRRSTSYLEAPQPVQYESIARVCLGRAGHFTLCGEDGVTAHYQSSHAMQIVQDISMRLAAALATSKSANNTPRASPRAPRKKTSESAASRVSIPLYGAERSSAAPRSRSGSAPTGQTPYDLLSILTTN